MTKNKNDAPSFLRQSADILIGLATLASLLLFAMRVWANISFLHPQFIMTSGCEEEALFSIWKYTQHQPVYADPHLIPFAGSYFNWLFYFLYGNVALSALSLAHADSLWLPPVCRSISLAFAATGAGICWLILGELNPFGFFSSSLRKFAWSLLLLINPLCGFWVMTARPDIGGLVLELAGFLFLLRYLRTRHLREILFAVVSLYAAWSFKHSYIAVMASGCLVLLFSQNWRALALLVVLWLALVMGTLFLGGSTYRASILLSQIHCAWHPLDCFRTLVTALVKMPFLPLGFLALFISSPGNILRLVRTNPAFFILLLATGITFAIDFLLSGKEGAADYYYITAALYSGLLLAKLTEYLRPSLVYAGLSLASCSMIAGIALVLSGRQGVVNWQPYYLSQATLAQKLVPLPGPVLVTDRDGNLPWVQTKPPYFVIAYTYKMDQDAGEKHEGGGWEGLVQSGYFGTVVTSSFNSIPESLLGKYELIDQDNAHRYYVRRHQ